jgi:hypothetical protein
MSARDPELQKVIDEFASQKNLPPNALKNVEEAIDSSIYLENRMIESIRSGNLKHIALTPNAHEGGHFNDETGTLALNRSVFLPVQQGEGHSVVVDRIVSVMGHEIGHSGQSEWRNLELKEFRGAISSAVWTEREPPNNHMDLTKPVDRYLDFTRRDEAMAEISGWNALADRVRGTKESVPEREMLERQLVATSCVDLKADGSLQLGKGIQLSDNGSIYIGKPMDRSANLEAVAACHYDMPAETARLGAHGDANYRNYYGAYAISVVASTVNSAEKNLGRDADDIRLDMSELKLDRTKLERVGLDLDGKSILFTDTSDGKLRGMSLRSTGSGTSNRPDTQNEIDQVERPPSSAAKLMSDDGHSANFAWLQAQSALGRSNIEGLQDLDQYQRERLTGSIAATVLADTKTNMQNITRVDASTHIDVESGRPQFLIPGQGDPHTEYYKRVPVDVVQALATPIEQSSEVAKVAMQSREQKQAQDLIQQQAVNQDGPSGPTMKIGGRTIGSSSDDGGGSGGDGGG